MVILIESMYNIVIIKIDYIIIKVKLVIIKVLFS